MTAEFIQLSGQSVPLFSCLFGFSQAHFCTYNLLNPPINFSLGEGVSALGLIVAVYQLRRVSWEITLAIRETWERYLFIILGMLGLLCVGFSAIVSQISIFILPKPFNYPLFYEMLGFLLFISSAISLFYFGTQRKGLFSQKRAEKFYNVILSEITRSTQETLEAAVNIIQINLPDIVKALKGKRMFWRNNPNGPPLTEDEIYASYADAVLTVILSDNKVVDYIVTARLDFLWNLLRELKTNKVGGDHTSLGINKIFKRLYENPRSHLYSQLEFSGFSLSIDVFKMAFGNIDFINKFNLFEPLPYSIADNKNFSSILAVFLKALETALESYWERGASYVNNRGLTRGFDKLADYAQALGYRANDKHLGKTAMDGLRQIGFFLGHTFPYAYLEALDKHQVPEHERTATKFDDYNLSLTAKYAGLVVDFVKALAILHDKDEDIRQLMIEPTSHILGGNSLPNDNFAGIRKIFTDLMWKEIEQNLKGWYPAVLRVYISVLGGDYGGENSYQKIERDRLVDLLEYQLLPKLLAGDTMGDYKHKPMEEILLPKSVTLNRTTHQFEYQYGDGHKKPMERRRVYLIKV